MTSHILFRSRPKIPKSIPKSHFIASGCRVKARKLAQQMWSHNLNMKAENNFPPCAFFDILRARMWETRETKWTFQALGSTYQSHVPTMTNMWLFMDTCSFTAAPGVEVPCMEFTNMMYAKKSCDIANCDTMPRNKLSAIFVALAENILWRKQPRPTYPCSAVKQRTVTRSKILEAVEKGKHAAIIALSSSPYHHIIRRIVWLVAD